MPILTYPHTHIHTNSLHLSLTHTQQSTPLIRSLQHSLSLIHTLTTSDTLSRSPLQTLIPLKLFLSLTPTPSGMAGAMDCKSYQFLDARDRDGGRKSLLRGLAKVSTDIRLHALHECEYNYDCLNGHEFN